MIPVSRPSLGPEELAAVGRVFESGWLGLGATTQAFEEELKSYLGAPHVIAVNTGTSALHLALASLKLAPGDEVVVPSMTFAASVQAILAAGGTPVFCEVHEENLQLDLDDVSARLTPRTRAVMPVHYCGNPCDMDSLLALAEAHGLTVVEDAAHAFGSTSKGRRIGSFGHLTCFSFDPIKNITTGEGGAVVLHDGELAEEIRRMRLLGIDKDTWQRYQNTRSWFYEVTTEGYRYHMPNFCAAVGLEQLKKLPGFIERRRAVCRRYDAAFTGLAGIVPLEVDYRESAPHIYIVRVRGGRRTAFMDHLKERGVGTGVHYLANHDQPYFRTYASGPLPRTERVASEIVTLPLHLGLTDGDVETVVSAVVSFEADLVTVAGEPVAPGRSSNFHSPDE